MRETVIQFGEGNFLRGFFDYFLDVMNKQGLYDGKAVIVQPRAGGKVAGLAEQECKYNLYLRGIENGEIKNEHTLVESVSACIDPYKDFESYMDLADNPDFRFIVSNTTEAGIVFSSEDKITDKPANTFPGKLTQLLYKRYELNLGGFVFLPCELIENNGSELKKCILQYADLWSLGNGFKAWIEKENIFTNTLVDRINTGYPKDEKIELDFDDKMVNTSEYFHLWVIDGYEGLFSELPFDKCGLNVILTKELKKYRTIKVRILNGSHTSMIPYALLSGVETVGDCLNDKVMSAHLKACQEEIVASLDMDKKETEEYAEAVMVRFANPYIRHMCQSIALNSVSKFKVRVLPSILDYERKYGCAPKTLLFSFGKLIEFYKKGTPNDDAVATEKMQKDTVKEILADTTLWGEDLTRFACEVEKYANS